MTLANKLSQKYNIKDYELDSIIWYDLIGKKRTNKEICELFDQIINKESYIIEDVGKE